MAAVSVVVYLSSVGLGLLALPLQVVQTFATAGTVSPMQTVNGITGAVDGGAQSQGWYMQGMLAAPMVVNLGALNLTWAKSTSANGSADLLGVKLGVLNTTVPMVCDGTKRVVLQLDSQAGNYSAKLSKIGAQSDTIAARVEYTCTP